MHLIRHEINTTSDYVKGRRCTECKRVAGKEETNRDEYIFLVVVEKLCDNYEFDIVDANKTRKDHTADMVNCKHLT